jgi:hypothetical protein
MQEAPHDDLNGVTIDPTGGPQGPFFTKDLSKYNNRIDWNHICEVNKDIWLDDEKRIDYIEMFGSLKTTITKDELLKYIDRISSDLNFESKHGYHSYYNNKLINFKQDNKPFLHFTFDKVFSKNEINDIKKLFNTLNFKSEEKEEVRQVYTVKRSDYKNNKILTNIVDKIANRMSIQEYSKWIFKTANTSIKDGLHLIRLVKDFPGYNNPAHMDKNNLLTMMLFLNFDNEENIGTELLDKDKNFVKDTPYGLNCGYVFTDSNSESTYHSFTKKINKCRYSIMYNIYENKEQYLKMYDTNDKWGIINKVRHLNEIKKNLFKTSELSPSRVDWNNERAIKHRKEKPFNDRFNKYQGCINYNSLSMEQVNDIIEDKKLDNTGDFFEKIKTLKQSRKEDTVKAELTWNPDKPENYLNTKNL